jgi:hypothetical protein
MSSCATVTRRLSVLACAASAAGLIAGCGGGSPAAAPTKTITETAPAGGTSSPATTPTPTPAATAAASPAGPPTCASANLKATLGVSQGAAGTIYQVIVLTNTSAAACTLFGYPGVSFVTSAGGSIIGAPADRNPIVPDALVTMQPGSQAYALVGVVQVSALPTSACRPRQADWLQIYPPGDTGALFVQYSSQVCGRAKEKFMTVSAVRSGAGAAS